MVRAYLTSSSNGSRNSTAEDGPSRSAYFVMMPHIDDEDLGPFEYRLLGHIRRKAGLDGVCNESMQTLAKNTRMGVARARAAIRELKRLGRIQVEYPAEVATPHLYPIDVMAENLRRIPNLKKTVRNDRPIKSDRPIENDRAIESERPGFQIQQDR